MESNTPQAQGETITKETTYHYCTLNIYKEVLRKQQVMVLPWQHATVPTVHHKGMFKFVFFTEEEQNEIG